MSITLFGIFEIYPLWKKVRGDGRKEQYLNILIGLMGLVSAFWSMTMSATSQLNLRLLGIVETEPIFMHRALANYAASFLISTIVVVLTHYIIVSRHPDLEDFDLFAEFQVLKESTSHELSLRSEEKTKQASDLQRDLNRYILLYILTTLILGFLAGIFYFIILYVPIFILYLFFSLLLSWPFGMNWALFFAVLVSQATIMYYLVKRKLEIGSEIIEIIDHQQDFQFSERTYEIMASNEPPIICPGCRSYIAATSKFCKVCGDPIEQSAN